jgi:hypothetical protein
MFGIITENFVVTFALHLLGHRTFLIYLIPNTTPPHSITFNQPFNHFSALPKLCVYKLMCSSE